MKAACISEYGPIEQLVVAEVPKPEPKENEVLVRNYGSSINFGNHGHIKGEPYLIRAFTGFGKPKKNIPGGDVSGVVESVGSKVTEFKAGDEVMGDSSGSNFGAYAEYVAVPEGALVLKPSNLSFVEAAVFPLAACVAYAGLKRKGQLVAGQKVLIIGSTGSVGPFAVQVAKALGAEVTAVCGGQNSDFVRGLGADHVIDYKADDFADHSDRYDLVASIAGFRSLSAYKKVLKPTGRYVSIGGNMKSFSQAVALGPIYSLLNKQSFMNLMYKANKDDLLAVKELIEAGKLMPTIDATYPLEEILDAFRYYESGKAAGKIAISIS